MTNSASWAAEPDYLKAYSLTCEPFADALDGRFFYGASPLMQQVDLLTHLTQFGESVILVRYTGEGKRKVLELKMDDPQVQETPINDRDLILVKSSPTGRFLTGMGITLGIPGVAGVGYSNPQR